MTGIAAVIGQHDRVRISGHKKKGPKPLMFNRLFRCLFIAEQGDVAFQVILGTIEALGPDDVPIGAF